VWDKWNLLKQRVAKLEGQVQYLRNVSLPILPDRLRRPDCATPRATCTPNDPAPARLHITFRLLSFQCVRGCLGGR
jgi:hypothetical protein